MSGCDVSSCGGFNVISSAESSVGSHAFPGIKTNSLETVSSSSRDQYSILASSNQSFFQFFH